MAHIRKSYNDLEEELRNAELAYYTSVQKHIEENKRRDRIIRIVWSTIGLAFTILLIGMICMPNISKEVQQRTTVFLMNKYEETSSMEYIFYIPESIRNMPFLQRLIPGLITTILRFLQSAILRIFAPIAGPVLRFLMYAIPALGPIFLVRTWSDAKYRVYSIEEAAESPFLKVLYGGQNVDIIRAGIEGEQAALDCLNSLDDDCYVFTNLHIPYEDKESETDVIVVSPAGVTIVEVKNYKGVIRGDTSDQKLIQDRGNRDESDDDCFYNPIKQVATHAYRLAGYLRGKNLPMHIRTCVFFVNPDSEVQLHDRNGILREKCPVFHVNQTQQLLRYLQSGTMHLSGETLDRVVKHLEQLME